MKRKSVPAIALIFLFLSNIPAFSDVTIKGIQHEDAIMGKPAKDSETTQYYSDKFVRFVNEDSDLLFNFETGEMSSIDHKKKEYMIIDFDKMKGLFEQMKTMMGETKISVEPTGQKQEILGKNCNEYLVKMESKMMNMEQRNWTCTDLDVNLDNFQAFFKKQLYLQGMDNAEEFLKLKGLPIQQEMKMSMMGMEMTHTFTPKEIIEDKIPASVFVIPAEYKKTEFDPAKMQE